MAVHPDRIKQLILKALPDAQVTVDDRVGDQNHLQATVVSNVFAGKPLLAQHQMVYTPLKETLKEELHALSLKTYSPDQWEKMGKK